MKSKLILGLILVLSISAVGTVAAQVLPVPAFKDGPADFIQSPTSFATSGRFSTAVDDYICPQWYTGDDVKFDKWFSFTSFVMPNTGYLGYARQFGGVYVGLYYGGTLWRGYADRSYTETDLLVGGSTKTFKDFTVAGLPDIINSSNDNRFAILIGLGDMGFRLSYASNHDSYKASDVTDGTNYKSYNSAYGWIAPQIQWGMTKGLTEKGIQPYVTVDLGFYRDFWRFEDYNSVNPGEQVDHSNNFIQPQLSIGLGGYTFYTGKFFEAAADLDYTFGIHLFNNDYSYVDANGNYAVKSIKGFNDAVAGLADSSDILNTLTPSVKLSYTGNDKLGLSAKLSLPLELDSAKITQYQAPGTDGSLIKDGVDGSLLYFSVRPVLNLGLQYQAIPGKLIINAGGRIETAQIDLSSGKFDTYNAGVKDPSNTKYKDTSFLGLAADTSNGRDAGTGLYAGVTFNFNQHIGLDTVMAYNIANPSNGVNGINLFGIGVSGSLTTFYQILVSLKF